jgi:hypothetical protein
MGCRTLTKREISLEAVFEFTNQMYID